MLIGQKRELENKRDHCSEQKAANSKKPERSPMRKKVIGFALSAVLFALCLSADAQQPSKIPRIGYLTRVADPSATPDPGAEVFRQGLRDRRLR